MSRNHNQ